MCRVSQSNKKSTFIRNFFLSVIQTKALGSRPDRNEWEKQFNNVYIQPVLEVNQYKIITCDIDHSYFFQKVDGQLGHVMTAIMNDDKQG